MARLSLLLACVLSMAGCRLTESTSTSYGSSGSYGSYGSGSSYGELTIDAAHQTGAMGEIRTFDGGGDRLESYRDGSSTFVQIDSIGSGWWVMSAISIDQDIDTLVPGVTYSTNARADVVATPDGTQPLSAEVRGCSGPEYTDYTYDDLAQQTTVRVEELTGGERRVHYDCTFVSDSGETQHTIGSFDYVPTTGGTGATGASAGTGSSVPVVVR